MWIKTASLLLFFGVLLGAFGAHALRSKLDAYGMDIYKTAVLYHFVHALGILAVGQIFATVTQHSTPLLTAAGIFFMTGIALFSGSLYLLSITGLKWLGAITPVGGVAFLLGWICLFLSIRV